MFNELPESGSKADGTAQDSASATSSTTGAASAEPEQSRTANDSAADAVSAVSENPRAEAAGAARDSQPASPTASCSSSPFDDTVERVRGLLRALAVARDEQERNGLDTTEGEELVDLVLWIFTVPTEV